MMMEALIGPVIHDLSISKLIREGYLAKPKIYFIAMPYTVNTEENYATLYKIIQQSPLRNQTIAEIAFKFALKNKTVLLSFSKVEHLKHVYKILEKINADSGKNLIIKTITGKNTAQQKTDALKKMDNNQFNIVLSTLFGEGVDVPNLEILINCRASKSEIDAYQQLGRVIRIVKGKKPIIIDFSDYNTVRLKKANGKPVEDFFKGYASKKIRLFEAEPEFELKLIDGIEEIEEIK
jgi:superfamily II DNA or RNA helicase